MDKSFKYNSRQPLVHRDFHQLPKPNMGAPHVLSASMNFGVKIKHIRSDNGTEFKNTGLDDYLDELGFTYELSAPCTPQQNGVVERKNRTLVEMACTMFDEYKTPRHFWLEAIDTACHNINRVNLHKFSKKPHMSSPQTRNPM
jgi:transposase InsO family protein